MGVQQIWHGMSFPDVVEASETNDLDAYLREHGEEMSKQLSQSGALLFRGFNVPSPQEFDDAVVAYGEPGFTYADSLSNAVRVNVTDRVFTANEAPPETSIYLHHEMAQTPLYPSKLFFYCQIAPENGGATPLCRSDILLEQLTAEKPELVAAFEAKGVRYTNVMPAQDDAGSGQGRSWRSTLSCTTRGQAEKRLAELNYDWEWSDDDTLRATTPRLDAVRTLSDGRKVFFNQLIAAFRGWSDSRNDPSRAICFGDGSTIDPDDMDVAIKLADNLTYDLDWQAGDVALVDNFLTMHGRRPFAGKRRVLAALIA